ncbi:hypothetical protein F8154_11435 [Alkaliphilus pronyensis]|uniref:LiaI-LiaF-like transmembrane region domain-containing protein n=1 Tax=Alkaliphilus pronyensis TaxID=1482732 RepID=A0A6I0FDM6_9FIRM|nr:DUF5668 domain-containing protein [Alkaliphilus pronyensis]KAB3532753.1 hypothetical protein F8154_11435 [Alkaliphilus pronyensis]
MMNRDRIIGGIMLISIGIMFLLINLGFISWSVFNSLFKLWPLLLVVVGVNTIFKKNTVISATTWILFIIAIISYGVYYNSNYPTNSAILDHITIEKHDAVEAAELKLKLGGLMFNVGGTADNLVEASIDNRYVSHGIQHKNSHKRAIVEFESKSNTVSFFDGETPYYVFKLNNEIPWSIDADVGAVSGEIDLRKLIIRDLHLKVGAGDVELILGDKGQLTDISINGGASNLDIIASKGLGIKARVDGGLNKTNLSNLGWIKSNGYYISPGYEEASSKAIIDIDAGVANINITRR